MAYQNCVSIIWLEYSTKKGGQICLGDRTCLPLNSGTTSLPFGVELCFQTGFPFVEFSYEVRLSGNIGQNEPVDLSDLSRQTTSGRAVPLLENRTGKFTSTVPGQALVKFNSNLMGHLFCLPPNSSGVVETSRAKEPVERTYRFLLKGPDGLLLAEANHIFTFERKGKESAGEKRPRKKRKIELFELTPSLRDLLRMANSARKKVLEQPDQEKLMTIFITAGPDSELDKQRKTTRDTITKFCEHLEGKELNLTLNILKENKTHWFWDLLAHLETFEPFDEAVFFDIGKFYDESGNYWTGSNRPARYTKIENILAGIEGSTQDPDFRPFLKMYRLKKEKGLTDAQINANLKDKKFDQLIAF